MTGRYLSEVVRVIGALLAPFIAVFGLYVIAHGHYGPGGGFVGGAVVGVGAILPRMTLDSELVYRVLPRSVGPLATGLGMLIFLVCGVLPMFAGGQFLDYGALANWLPWEPSYVRYLLIMFVEIGVGVAVFGAMVAIFDVLTDAPEAGS